ncbi:MAG: glycosyltransferase 87 family protein [Anaeroplasmataceae bacterium]
MDFFNSVRDAHNKGVYVDRNVIYPPLINIIYYLYSKLMPSDLVSVGFEDRFLLANDTRAIMVFVLYNIINFMILFFIILFSSKDKKKNISLLLLIITSMPFIWAIERGNSIILSISFTLGFILYRNHDKKVIRFLSYIFLAIATAIKLYPIIFSLLLIKEKKYKDFIILGLITFFMVFFPFVFYDGIKGVKTLINNILSFSSLKKESVGYYTTSIALFLNRYGFNNTQMGSLFLMVILLISFLVIRDIFKSSIALVLFILNLSGTQVEYNLLYLLIPFVIYYIGSEDTKKSNIIFIIVSLLLIPNPIYLPLLYHPALWYHLVFPTIIALIVVVLIEVIDYIVEIIVLKSINFDIYLY